MSASSEFETLSPPNDDPFWATRLWQQLIQHIQLHVKIGRHRHRLKHYSNVFLGNDLVDEVFIFLKNYPSNVITQDITKKNAFKVCHVLMENKVFEPVVPQGLQKFEDGSSKFYRFLDGGNTDLSPETSCDISDEKENQKSWFSSHSLSTSTSQFVEFCKVSAKERDAAESKNDSRGAMLERNKGNSVTSRISMRAKKKNRLDTRTESSCPPLLFENQWTSNEQIPPNKSFSYRNFRKSLSRSSSRKIAASLTKQLPQSSSEVHDKYLPLKDAALAHLLALVDIPVLETILSVPWDLPKTTAVSHPLVIQNDPCETNKADSVTFLDVIRIPWVQAAVRCLPKHPNGINSLWSVQACKIHCYQSVVDYYSSVSESVIPESFMSICTAVIDLVKQNKRKNALCALQLMVIFLPQERRIQLKNLLQFLLIVIEDIFVNIDKKMTNYEAVSRDFMRTVFSHPLVAKEHCQVIFDFMTFKAHSLFDIPSFLQHCGLPGPRFCERTCVEDFESVTSEFTSKSLQSLVFSVMDCPHMPLKEKKNWLKKFNKVYPDIYSN